MKIAKKVMPVLVALALYIGSSAIPVYAETGTATQDGLSVTYTTDKERYGSTEEINVMLSVTNNNADSVYDVQLEEIIPDGYILADNSQKFKRISELKSGENERLDATFIKNKSEVHNVASLSNNSSKGVTTANVRNNTTSSNVSVSNKTVTNDSKNQSESSPNTGDNRVTVISISIVTALCVMLLSAKHGKGKQMLSLILATSLLTLVASETNLDVKAAGTEINVSTTVNIDGKDVLLSAKVKYSIINDGELSIAEQYYKDNATILSIEQVSEENTLSEQEVCKFLAGKGFTDYPITYDYSLSGDFNSDQESSSSSGEKHPMYGTYYISKNNEIWYVTVVGKDIFANPISFNMQTERDVPTMLSVSNSIIGYDDEKNRLYTIIPKETAMIVVKIEDINAEILDSLTVEEVGKL